MQNTSYPLLLIIHTYYAYVDVEMSDQVCLHQDQMHLVTRGTHFWQPFVQHWNLSVLETFKIAWTCSRKTVCSYDLQLTKVLQRFTSKIYLIVKVQTQACTNIYFAIWPYYVLYVCLLANVTENVCKDMLNLY